MLPMFQNVKLGGHRPIITLMFLAVLGGCSRTPSMGSTSQIEMSEASSLSSAFQAENRASSSIGYTGPFKQTEMGYVGTVVVKGYPFIKTQKYCPEMSLDDSKQQCDSYPYVIF